MSEHKRKKSKSSRHSRKYESSRYSDKKRSKTIRSYEDEIKTPPLPTKNNATIEHLLKTRESLKEELRKMSSNDSKSKNSKTEITSNKSGTRKRHSSDFASESHKSKRMNRKELSPEITDPLDSEDEESIIEQRRRRRKELLEKYENKSKQFNEKNESEESVSNTATDNENVDSRKDEGSANITSEVKDMFAEKDDFKLNCAPDHVTQDENPNNTQLNDDWDDAENYYNIKVGDILNKRYTIKTTLGKGMFANVVLAVDKEKGNSDVAIKIARNNELMYKNALKEIAILKEIIVADTENKHHCVKYMRHFTHKSHLCIVMEPLGLDLRSVLKKYGKNIGLNIKALMTYSRQLLMALRLLKRIGIIHADIKPDNILVNEKKNLLKLCDFGSAEKFGDNDPKPYLVSRFYRAPEIILGLPYGHAIDLWSSACTIYELSTGKIMFTGASNNRMLKCFMDVKGKIPNKMLKRGKFKDQHFNYNHNFLLHKKDELSGREKVTEIFSINVTRNLLEELKKAHKNASANEEKKLQQLKDMIDKMIMLDPNQRLSLTDCLNHPFIKEEMQN